ncbi:ABC transporter permease [Dechloromonas sp. XY25]|uniref:Transport permease protein n=1 Tax=Dechloromonas hankyongensis TaxID=2908002 RepID=A0ABS9JZD7_9RHOO|nr:ABC transporter permease [Dechloromonas hankyongensis]MCG2576271.1 ABC transporter permease [Dechloromonas hankyongensis]
MINLFKMNVRDRYLGSSLGSFWAITNPLFMLSLYTYVFGFVFKIRLPGAEATLVYVIWLISGYGPWIALNESITGAANSVVGASGLVKNMAFKTELLPIAGTLVGLINLAVSLCFLFVLLVWSGNPVTWHLLFLPLVMALQFAFAAALGLWLSAITVFVRDVIQILPTLLTAIMFMTPIFYPFEKMPAIIQKITLANPLYHISEGYRVIIIASRMPDMVGLGYVAVISFVIFYFGLRAFRRAKGAFDSAI